MLLVFFFFSVGTRRFKIIYVAISALGLIFPLDSTGVEKLINSKLSNTGLRSSLKVTDALKTQQDMV